MRYNSRTIRTNISISAIDSLILRDTESENTIFMKLAFATGNMGKLREASEILGEGTELVSAREAGVTEDIPETGKTLSENSLQKASYFHQRCMMDCFADDSGLEVDALGGAPGVYTARYGGDEGHDPEANMARLLKELDGVRDRKARFHTVITYIGGDGIRQFEGFVEGRISAEKRGSGGFGYDPVFVPDMIPTEDGTLVPNSGRLTMAEISEDAKNRISHRGVALRAMAQWLRTR